MNTDTGWPPNDPYVGVRQAVEREWKMGTRSGFVSKLLFQQILGFKIISGVYVAEHGDADWERCHCRGPVLRSWLRDSRGLRTATIPDPLPTFTAISVPFP